MLALVSSGLVGFLAYLLLAGSISASELITGALLGSAVAGWTALAWRVTLDRFRFSWAQVPAWGRAFADLPRQTRLASRFLFFAIFRPAPSQGAAETHPFSYGVVDDSAERGRRATAVLAASIAPASYVVEVKPGHDETLIHSIGAALEESPRWLV